MACLNFVETIFIWKSDVLETLRVYYSTYFANINISYNQVGIFSMQLVTHEFGDCLVILENLNKH